MRDWLGWLVLAGCALAVVVRAATAEAPRLPRAANQAQIEALAEEAGRLEGAWGEDGRRAFPGDLWSQDDDFHHKEMEWARGAARRLGVRLGDALKAIDRGLRAAAAGTPLRATVPPCKPRPFYD
jgi:hypothetical protein